MSLAVFNSAVFQGTASRAELGLAGSIWSQEIAALPAKRASAPALPGFVLVGVASLQGQQLVFSSMHALGLCPPAENSRSAEDIYVQCPLRITRYGPDSKAVTRQLTEFCFLYSDDQNNPAQLNHTEYAFDEQTGTAYFRVIQHGLRVPACDRSVTIKP
ncbi:hypothetical protein D8I35_03270 [Corticibacter populi]|uniref:Uncharacterized protein n=1 Tax=Corticibacter populi TaxID=1550736 RepID=A0A3M6R029_9BURK|nr:hypothetical protein [Corticibacter populi]RMX08152.1 hypothetical protein D8I35_03270 [Corticibacter populi]